MKPIILTLEQQKELLEYEKTKHMAEIEKHIAFIVFRRRK